MHPVDLGVILRVFKGHQSGSSELPVTVSLAPAIFVCTGGWVNSMLLMGVLKNAICVMAV